MNIFLLDKNLKIQDTLSSEGGVLTPPFFNDEYEQVLETGVETFTFETLPSKFLETGNYVAFMYNNEHKLFQISEIEEKHEDDYVVKVYCEFAGLELTYEVLRPRKIPSANISQYLENVLSDTDWEVGNVDSTINGVFTIDIDSYDKVYSNIQENIKKYECEISFRVEMKNGRVTHKYIDVYKQRGRVTNYRFEYSKNMTNVTRTTNVFDLVTALVGIGKNDMTFKEAEWSKEKGDFADKPKNQDFIADEEAFAKYNNNGSHLMGYFKCDLESPYDILNATYKELQNRKQPKVEYEMDVEILDIENIELGDEIYAIDNDWHPEPLHLSARINSLIISFTDSSKNKCTMSNYKKVQSRIKNDVSSLLNQINNSMFMGVAKGGLLNSNLAASNFDISIKNKMIDENGKEYFFDVRNKKASTFLDNISNTSVKVTQSFAIDFVNNHIYATQVEDDNTTGNIILSKIDFNGKVLGKMYLKAFGHGNQIGIDRIDGTTKIWVECDGAIASGGSFFGKKVCRFEFINNKTCYNHEGNVYSLAPSDSEYVFVAVNEESDRLGIRYKQNGKFYFEVYSLRSVLNNTPQLLAKILRPSTIETSSKSPNQGFALHANMIYNYEGFSYDQTDNKNNIKISCIDFKGNVLYSQYITHAPNLSYREPEGLFFRQVDETIFELYFGITSGAAGARKFNIYKFTDSVGESYEKRGSFLHSNGHASVIEEGVVRTGYTGSTRKNAYLLYVNKKDRFIYEGDISHQFIVAEFRNGKWYHREKEFETDMNDAIIGEIQEKKDGISLVLFTQDFNAIKGQDGVDGLPGQDALFLELTNEYHSIPTDANGNNGIYSGCETSLKLYRGDIQLTNNVAYSVKSSENVIGNLVNNKYTVTNLTGDTGYVDLVANYLGNEYVKRFSLSKNKQGLSGEDGLTPIVYWLMTSASTISKDSRGNLKPSSVTFWAKSQTGEDSVVNYQGIFKIYESIDGNVFTLKHTSELDDTVPYTPSSTAQSIKCELYLSDGITLIDQDIVNIVKDGTDGFSGADAKYVLLTGEQLFKYTNNFTGTPTPSSITLTGTPFNISSSNAKWYYKKSSDTNYTLISANNGKMEFTLNHNDSTLFANNNKVVTIKFDIDGYYDEMTIAKISDGSSGSDGEDGYFVLLTNENHTVPCENDGTVVNGELEKAKTEIHVFKGTQEVSFSMSKTDVGCTSTYDSSTKTLSITSLTSKTATVTMQITVNGTVFTKVMTISKATKGDTGEDSYTVDMTNDNYSFNCDAKGNIASVITTTTVITAFKGVNPVVPTIGILPTVAGLTLSKSNGIITIKANTGTSLADNGSFDIPVTVGGNNFIKTFSWTKVKNGSNGSNGISVTSTDVEYAQNTSATTAPTTGWTTTAPTWQNGKYIWSRTKTVLSDGTTKYTNPACITGQQGNNGATGTGITSITEEYYLSTSKTTQTGGSWVTTPPTWSTGKYMWTRSKIVYNNPTSTVYTTPICDSSWEVVNEIDIGGRNFVLNGGFKNAIPNTVTIPNWGVWGNILVWTDNQAGQYTRPNSIYIANNSTIPGGIYQDISSTKIPPNTEVTFTGFISKEASVLDTRFVIEYYDSSDNKISLIDLGNGEVNKTFITHSTYHRLRIVANHSGSSSAEGGYLITVGSVKLEKGNKSTDWTPAPEDIEKEISDVSSSLGSLEGSIKDAFGDGIINDSEARALASNIQILNNEKSDLDKEVSTVYANSNLGGTAKTNLNNANTDYRNAHSSLISAINTAIADKIITDSERNSVDSFFNTYRTKLQTLRQRLQEANDYISTNKVDNIQIGVTNLALGTNQGSSGWHWIMQAGSVSVTSEQVDGVNCVKFIKTSDVPHSGWSYVGYTNFARKLIEPDTEYVLSFDVKSNRDYTVLANLLEGNATNSLISTIKPVSNIIPSNNTWTKVVIKLKSAVELPTSTRQVIYITGFDTSEGAVHYVKNLKLEKGNKATDWTPAPEDVDNAIGENIKTVDVMYYLSTSQTSLAGGNWSTTAPTWVNGKYMWSKTVTTLANGTVKESSPTCIAGAKGDTGSAGKGVKSIVEQYYLSTSQTSLSGGSWSTTVPTWQQGKYIWTRSVITYTDNTTTTTNGICVSGSKGDKGDAGTNGTNGVNGTSPVLVTITGQQSMKYLDKTSAPVPSTITLTANVMEGNVVVSSGITYIWQYKNSSGTWVNLSGTYTGKTYSLAHNNTGFVNEVAQIRVAVSYKSKTYYLEHTVTKIYDNKYISKQEVFDKITEGGVNQLIYKDPSTGEIYINATFIKSGQLVADLIKGGILTLGGAIGTDDNPVNGYMRVLGVDNQELAVLNGGEMTINGLSSDEATIDSLFVQDIKSPKIPPAVTENTTIYVNQTTGNDDAEFDNGAVYKTVQGAIDATPKNLNGFDVYIRLQGTSSGGISIYSENLIYKGFYGGTLYTYLQKNSVHGYVVMRDCSARLSLVGGSNYDEIPDDLSANERANVKPASLYNTGNTYYSIVAINCTDVYIRALDLWGSTKTNTNGNPNYAIGSREGSNVFVRNVKILSSSNGFHAQVMGRLFTINTHGKVTTYAYRCTYGGWMTIGSGTSVSGATKISTGDGCQILQGNVTWDGSSSTGTNDNTTVNSNTTTYNATSGDSWKVKYSSWRKDNTVRQGDWSGTGMHKGCWFFGSQFNDIKGKTIKSIKLTIQRQSSGGNSGAVAFTLKMHNHTGRPSGAPSYLSGWSKNVSLSLGQSSTITITDSAVLTAIKNGTMKGFGVEVSSTSNSYYGILSPKLKAVVTYS